MQWVRTASDTCNCLYAEKVLQGKCRSGYINPAPARPVHFLSLPHPPIHSCPFFTVRPVTFPSASADSLLGYPVRCHSLRTFHSPPIRTNHLHSISDRSSRCVTFPILPILPHCLHFIPATAVLTVPIPFFSIRSSQPTSLLLCLIQSCSFRPVLFYPVRYYPYRSYPAIPSRDNSLLFLSFRSCPFNPFHTVAFLTISPRSGRYFT